jgi:type VI secretion system secreted protein Hcp
MIEENDSAWAVKPPDATKDTYTNMFFKLKDITGDSIDSKHKDEIVVRGFRWGVAQPGKSGSGAGGGTGKAQVHDFEFVTQIGSHTAKIAKAAFSGQHFTEGTLTACKAGTDAQDYMVTKFSNFIITHFEIMCEQDQHVPAERWKVNFSKVDISCKAQKEDGTLGGAVESTLDVSANKAS